MGNSSPKVPKLGNLDDKKDKISKFSGATPRFPLKLLFFATKNKGRKKGCQSFFSEGGGEEKRIFGQNIYRCFRNLGTLLEVNVYKFIFC